VVRKLLVVAAVASVVGSGVVIAQKPPGSSPDPALDPDWNFLTLDAELSPPHAGTSSRPQAAGLHLKVVAGNAKHGKFARVAGIRILVPRGVRTNASRFPTCPLPGTAEEAGRPRCSKDALVGSGRALVDARDLKIEELVPAELSVYNGEPVNGDPTLIVLAEGTVDGNPFRAELDFAVTRPEADEAKRYGYAVSLIGPQGYRPGDEPPPYYPLVFELRIERSITTRSKGTRRTFPFIQTPTTCNGAWRFRQEDPLRNGAELVASDSQPCSRRRR
jgi:hypothetical protein